MDSWKDNDIELISLGGNKKLNELLSLYNINKKKLKDSDQPCLYKTKIMDFYRKLLKCELNGDPRPTPISRVDALKSFEEDFNPKKLEEYIPGNIDISDKLTNINYNENYNSGVTSSSSFTNNNNDRFASGNYNNINKQTNNTIITNTNIILS